MKLMITFTHTEIIWKFGRGMIYINYNNKIIQDATDEQDEIIKKRDY